MIKKQEFKTYYQTLFPTYFLFQLLPYEKHFL
jgi:hypothetical protein